MSDVIVKAYTAELFKLPVQFLLLLATVPHLIVVTLLETLPVEWRDGVRGLFELITSLFVVAFVILVI